MSQLIKGVAYHGNRMLSHVREDMRELAVSGFNTVLHTFSHNDLDRNRRTMKEIFDITSEYGMDVWADNWGLGGPPGDKSHFLSYHPESHQIGSDGLPDPVRVCYTSPAFEEFTKEWIDAVYEAGARKIFWDEPHFADVRNGNSRVWTCRCARCRAMFNIRYGHEMPDTITPEVDAFRKSVITDYFKTVAGYAKKKGMYNAVCVMFANGENAPNFGVDLDSICSSPALDNIGSDPYWLGAGAHGYTEVYKFVYERARHNIELCEKYGKDHNLWLQTFSNPAENEDEIIAAADALYDAGARSIFAWGFRGSDSTDYRAIAPDRTWYATKAAYERLSNRYRDELRAAARAALNLD